MRGVVRGFAASLTLAISVFGASVAALGADTCPGNPDALGTSRTITVDPAALPRIGKIQYRHTLPLKDHEVVITFDDGPLPPYTDRVLDTLAANCVKVTYFLVGRMARAYPETVRRIFKDGHVIGTHSLSHPFTFDVMGEPNIAREVTGGISAVKAALGDPRAVAPFFRIPGLARSRTVESYLAAKSLAVWSADEVADDWHRGITAKDITQRALRRIEANGHRGVLLLHDIHPATALALPTLLKELKKRGYKIVQAIPPGVRPKSLPERPSDMIAKANSGWPRILKTAAVAQTTNRHKKSSYRHRRQQAQEEGEVTLAAKLAKKKKGKAQTAETAPNFFPLFQ